MYLPDRNLESPAIRKDISPWLSDPKEDTYTMNVQLSDNI